MSAHDTYFLFTFLVYMTGLVAGLITGSLAADKNTKAVITAITVFALINGSIEALGWSFIKAAIGAG